MNKKNIISSVIILALLFIASAMFIFYQKIKQSNDYFPEIINKIPEQNITLEQQANMRGYNIKSDAVYYKEKIVLGVDVKTFTYLGGGYSKDKNSAYYDGGNEMNPDPFSAIKDADVKTFEYVGWESYAKDAKNVYIGSQILNGADTKSFEAVYYRFSKDKNNVYEFGKINGANPVNCTAKNVNNCIVLEIGEWKKYKNEKYGYSLSYPARLKLTVTDNNAQGCLSENDICGFSSTAEAITQTLKEYLSYRNSINSPEGLGIEKEFSISSYPAVVAHNVFSPKYDLGDGGRMVLVIKDGNLFTFSVWMNDADMNTFIKSIQFDK